MTRSIALLRGINVGGNRKVKMADLRAHLGALGYRNVSTYIQSGNVVLDHDAADSTSLGDDLSAAIEALCGFAVPTMVRSAAEWGAVIAANPFPTDDPTKLHVLFVDQRDSTTPFRTTFDEKVLAPFGPEALDVRAHELYLFTPDGMGVSKLAPALNRVKVATTGRNWRTIVQLADLL